MPKQGIFGPTFQHFCFLVKFCNQTNSRGADFKYDNIVFKSQPKNTYIRDFWAQIQAFLFLHEIINQTHLKELISNMTILFSSSSPKIPKSGIFGPECRHFCFFLKFGKQTNFMVLISNITTIILAQKYPNKAVLGRKYLNLAIFFLHKILQSD